MIFGLRRPNSHGSIPLDEAVRRYLVYFRNEFGATERTHEDYKGVLRRLTRAYPDSQLSVWEPPAGDAASDAARQPGQHPCEDCRAACARSDRREAGGVSLLPPLVHAAWVRPGGATFPDQAKARGWGVDQFFWDANDPAHDHPNRLAGVLNDMRAAHWKVGINRNMRNEEWPDSETDATKFGFQLSADLTRLGCDGKQGSAIMDAETHDMAWILAALKAFRLKRNGRFLYWTLEPRQGGLLPRVLVDWINNDPLTWIVVQKYRGGMQPVSERLCIENLVAAGVKLEKILVYYERYEEGFEGIIFDIANAR